MTRNFQGLVDHESPATSESCDGYHDCRVTNVARCRPSPGGREWWLLGRPSHARSIPLDRDANRQVLLFAARSVILRLHVRNNAMRESTAVQSVGCMCAQRSLSEPQGPDGAHLGSKLAAALRI